MCKDGFLVSVSPPKSVSIKTFEEKYTTEEDFSNLVFEEFVEGSMVNVFYHDDEWRMNTRSLVGGRGQFYKEGKTFRRMFLEAMEESSLEFDDLDKSYSYSFVFLHPEYRIVVPCQTPKLYLCQVYNIEGTIVKSVDFRSDEELCGKVNVPKRYDGFTTWESVRNKFSSTVESLVPYYVMGVVIYEKEGNRRSKLRNPTYETVRNLRGNEPKTQYQYYSLRKQGIVRDFLHYYPEYKESFSKLRDQVHRFTMQLHQNYMDCFIFKKNTLKEFPYEYRTHMYMLHKKYLEELLPQQQRVTKYIVMDYINSLEPPRLMYSINYKLRKQNNDEKQMLLSQ